MAPFGIIMPNWNKYLYICQAIDSVLAQRDPDWRLVIADDSSTDLSVAEAERRRDPRIRIIVVPHGGPGHASRAAVEEIRKTGVELVGILDSDDALHPDAVGTVRKAYSEYPECGLIYTQNWMCDAMLRPIEPGRSRRIEERETILDLIEKGPPLRVAHWKTFRLSDYDRTEGFAPLARHQDMDIVLKLEEVTKLHFVDGEPLYYWRLLEDGLHTGNRIKDFSYAIHEAARIRRCANKRIKDDKLRSG